jgi:hypothetical protein
METEAWPDESMHITFLTEGPASPLPPPDVTQITHRFPHGTRITFCGAAIGFVVAHDDYPPMWVGVDGSVKPAPEEAHNLIETRANTMTSSDVLRFGRRCQC